MSVLVYEINDPSPPAELETSRLFDVTHSAPSLSAIDMFFEKTIELNQLLPPQGNFSGPLPNLILLGYVSAVESYFRDIIRRLILIDPTSREACEKKTLTYGAAVSHEPEKMPEALLEDHSFANMKNIVDAFREFIGIKGDLPGYVKVTLRQFSTVCQLRHCIVHRFGHLGSKNAIDLGLTYHKECLEKPLKMEFGSLQQIFLVCTNVVKTSNAYLFHKIFDRAVRNGRWSWDYEEDRQCFEEFFSTFVNKNPERTPEVAYKALREHYRNR